MHEIGLLDFLDRRKVEAGQRHLRHPADDPRQPVHHRRCDRYRRAHRPADGGIHGDSTARKGCTACSSRAPSCWPAFRPSYTASSAWSLSCRAVRAVAALFGADVSGSSILAASILLGIMILPTIIGVSEAALRRGSDELLRRAPSLMGARPRARGVHGYGTGGQVGRAGGHRARHRRAPSARPWRSSWWPATSRALTGQHARRACAP